MIAINILANWVIIFIVTGLIWNLGTYPGDYIVLITSIGITFIIMGLSLSPLGERISVMSEGGRKPTANEKESIKPYLMQVLSSANMNPPKLYISDSMDANARAVGRESIIINRGLIESTTPNEMCGVIAHELGHLYYKDTVRLNLMAVMNYVGAILSYGALAVATFCTVASRRLPILAPIFLLAFILKAFQLIMEKLITIGVLAIGRKEELRADRFAAKIGFGDGLASYLKKRDKYTRHKKTLKTHPPTALRLEVLTRK